MKWNNIINKYRLVSLLLLLFWAANIQAQTSSVSINLNVIPPYSPYLSDYVNNQNKTIITIIPTAAPRVTQLNIYFKASLEGDNEVSIISKTGYKPSNALTISALFPTTLSGKQLANYFNTSNMVFSGITLRQLVNGDGLPEGTYTICLQAFDYETDLPLSAMSPSGCTAPIVIKHPDPPLPMVPNCASVVTPKPIQNILFNWTYNPGYTPQLQYLLKMVPVLPTQNANDAINTMVTPAFFEKIITSTSFLYGPSDPLLVKGQTYAYRIKVFDPQGKILFKNNGESEVCTFTYGDLEKSLPPILVPKNDIANIEIENPFCGKTPTENQGYYIKWKSLANFKNDIGKYRVEIAKKEAANSKSDFARLIVYIENTNKNFIQGNVALLKLVDKKEYQFRVVYTENNTLKAQSKWCDFTYNFVPPKLDIKPKSGITVKGQFAYNHKGLDGEFVINNASITIKERYFIADKNNLDNVKYVIYKNPITNEALVEHQINTNQNGEINYKTDIQKLGIVQDNYSVTTKYGTFSGALVRGLEVKLNNNYYEYLSKEFSSANNDVLDIGKLMTKTITFDLTVSVKKGYKSLEGVQENCENCLVTLWQNQLPDDAPRFKKYGVNQLKNNVEYTKLLSETTQKAMKNGKEITQVVFNNLICTKKQSHHYLVQLQFDPLNKGTQVTQVYADPKFIELTHITNKLPKSSIKGQIFYTYKGSSEVYPLQTSLKLMVVYVIYKNGKKIVLNDFNLGKIGQNDIEGKKMLSNFNQKYPDNGKSVDWKTSNSNGEFEFNFENIETYTNQTNKFSDIKTGEFGWNFQGDVYRCLRVVVNNGFYTNPDEDIFIEPLQTVQVGKLTAVVKSFNIELKCVSANIKGQTVVSGEGVPGLDVVVRRKGKMPNYFPNKEGNILKAQNVPDYLQAALNTNYVTTNQNGIALIRNLVITDGQDFAKLYFYALSPDLKGDFSYNGFIEKNYTKNELISKMYQMNQNFFPDAVFNSDYIPPTISLEIKMFPSKPKIKGRVLDISKSSIGLADAIVTLETNPKSSWTTKKILTDKDGYFEFNDLVVNKSSNGTVTGPNRIISINKAGYHYQTFIGMKLPYKKELGILKEGSQVILPEIYLKPNSSLTGKITDENGQAVDCYIGALGADLTESKFEVNGAKNGFITFGSNYEISLPPGKNIKIVVWPKDLKYFIDTITIPEIIEGKNTFDILVFKRLHRFKVVVKEKVYVKQNSGIYIEKTNSIANAIVEIEGNTSKTDNYGEATLQFANTSTKNFTIRIKGPIGQSYIEQNIKATNFETKNKTSQHVVYLTKGQTISGKVNVKGGNPINKAKIIIERGAGIKPLEVLSNEQGIYILEGIQMGHNKSVIIKVTAPSDEKGVLIGKEETFSINTNNTVKNFELERFSEFNVSVFYGFKLEITKLKKINDYEVEVAGFVDFEGKSIDFSLAETGKISFDKLRFKKGEKNGNQLADGIPLTDELVTNSSILNLKYGKHINTQLYSNFLIGKTLTINKENKNAVCKGYMHIVDNSFDFPGSYLSFGKSIFHLKHKDENSSEIKAFSSNIQKSFNTYNICNYKGEALKYKFLQFEAESNPQTSTVVLNSQGVPTFSMDTKIKAKFNNITPSDLIIDLGVFEMNHEKIMPKKGGQNIKFGLENWTVEVKNWQITTDKGGITASEGFVNTGVVNVPFKKFHMQNNLLKFDEFTLNDLKLGNIVNLSIGNGSKAIFGFDQSTGTDKKPHWKLTLVGNASKPAASFTGIDGLATNTKVNIEVLSLISNGENLLSFGASPQPLMIYDVVKFIPTTITNYSDYFTLGGKLDYGIPNVSSDLTGNIKVVKFGNAAKFELMPQQIEFEGKGFVKYLSLGTSEQKQKISKNKLEFFGTIQEPGKTQAFLCKLSKSSFDGDCLIDLLPNQVVQLGDKKLIKVTGIKESKNKAWGYFSFEGDLQGFTGVDEKQKHLKFTVYGDIKAEGQAIKCDNINTPFGGMELTFDFGKGELIGHMDVNMDFSEALAVKGVANMRFGGNGFYIAVAAQITAPVVNTFNAGVLVGSYKGIPSNVLQDVVKYNYNKNVPCHLTQVGINGFFITGARELPLQVPNFSVDIPPGLALVSLSVGATSGVEAQLAMDFSSGLILTANLLVYAKAWASIASISCTEASANATAELLVKGTYQNKQFFIDGCGSVVLAVKGSQKVPILVGCTSPEISLETNLGVKYIIHIGSDGFYQKVQYSVGADATNCNALLNCK